MGDCVIAMRKSLTARFMMKKLGGVRIFLLLKHMIIEQCQIQSAHIPQNNMLMLKLTHCMQKKKFSPELMPLTEKVDDLQYKHDLSTQ